MSHIPKIIHQIWIGDKLAPTECMQTWRNAHPDYEYIFWNEAEIERRGIAFESHRQIEQIAEINGKADIMRWEILWRYGGFFFDADSVCIEPLDAFFEGKRAFATYESESIRKGLVATGTLGFIPGDPLCRDIIDWILSDKSEEPIRELRAWGSVGPGLLTQFLNTGNYPYFTVYPSYTFLPIHFTGLSYRGHRKVYGHQLWGTGKELYGNHENSLIEPIIPCELGPPNVWVSVFITSYNTRRSYIHECLDSIRNQTGHFGIELVWVNDGSTPEYTAELKDELTRFTQNSRFTRVIYESYEENRGMTHANNVAIDLATSELLFKMDSDDLMLPDRIEKQMRFMEENPECVACGSQARLFMNHVEDSTKKAFLSATNHPERITWDEFYRTKPEWFVNHPTACFRKSALDAVGRYNSTDLTNWLDDYDLFARLLKRFGEIRNMSDILLLYRIHERQYSKQIDQEAESELRNKIIETL